MKYREGDEVTIRTRIIRVDETKNDYLIKMKMANLWITDEEIDSGILIDRPKKPRVPQQNNIEKMVELKVKEALAKLNESKEV